MLSPIFGATQSTLSTSATQYDGIMGTFGGGPVGTESAKQLPVSVPFTIFNLYFQVSVAPGAGASYTLTVMRNGVATALTATISGASTTSATDSADVVSFGIGDLIDVQITPVGTPTASTKTYWNMRVDSGSSSYQPLFGAVNGLASTSATQYMTLSGMGNTFVTTEAQAQIVVPTSGTLQDFSVLLDGTPGGSASYAVTVMQNGSASALTTTITGSALKNTDGLHKLTLTAGDTLSIQQVPSGTPTTRRIAWCFRFIPTNDGESFFGFGSANAPSTTATNFEQLLNQGAGGWSATESGRLIIPGACTLTALYAVVGTAPGGITTRTFMARKNSGTTLLAATITGASTAANITGQTITMAQTDTLGLQAAEVGTPTADTNGVHVGILAYIVSPTYVRSDSAAMLLGV